MLRYPQISHGYLGERYKDSTLSSSFFAEVWQDFSLLDSTLCFPQRVPKTGYFLELCSLEKKYFQEKLQRITAQITNELQSALITGHSTIRVNNLLYLALRYSLFDEILSITMMGKRSQSSGIEIKFIYELAKLEKKLSCHGSELLLDGLIAIANKLPLEPECNIRVLNRIIVFFYRYAAHAEKSVIKKLLDAHISEVNTYQVTTTREAILKSMAYRGIAMASDLGEKKQAAFLSFAEEHARNITPQGRIEEIAVSDNLYTCLQSVAKWHIYQKNYTEAEKCLEEVCKLDPFDFVGYCEMAMFLSRLDRFSEANFYFEKAAVLGPPGVGMNTYFQAKCLEKISRNNEAILTLQKASAIDPNAVSPLLDLFYYYKNNNSNKFKEIAKKIMVSATLVEQLNPDELYEIKNVLVD